MRTILFFCLSISLVATTALLSGCSLGEGASPGQTVNDPAAALVIAHWVKGEQVDIAKGVNVVEFWAMWCGPCVGGMPHLSELQGAFAEDVTIVGISNEPLSTVPNPYTFDEITKSDPPYVSPYRL